MSTETTTPPAAPLGAATPPGALEKPPGKENTPVPTIPHNSPDEIERRVRGAIEHFQGKKPRAMEPPKPVEKAKEEPKGESEATKGESTVDKKPKAEVKPKKEDSISDEIQRGFDKVAKKLEKPAKEEPKPEPKTESKSDLSPKDEAKLRVFEAMAKDNEEYAALPAKFKEFAKSEKRYIEAWQKKNPGETFNANDDAHEDWYAENEPQFEQDDYVDARADLKATEKFEKLEKFANEKRTAKEREAALDREAKSAIADAGDSLAKEVLGKDTKLEDLSKEDRVTYKYIKEAEGDLNELVGELFKVFTPAENSKRFDAQNKHHVALERQLTRYEQQIAGMDEDQTTRVMDGVSQKFTTMNDYVAMSPQERSRHWTVFLEPALVKTFLVKDFAELVKGRMAEDTSLWEERLAKGKGQTNGKAHANGNGAPPKEEKPAVQKPSSPTVTGGDRNATPIDPLKQEGDERLKPVVNFFRGVRNR